ncbi:hypothetical protein LRS74_23070 [Streptomyces sp. LX-29]|uniref:SCO3933 family regulatory protein n=1 Tax=Streptomyces sp. LX-29 TaxID=2900152 RepID=UPI00240E964D|nr:hypothetical protein [Streptomyces sp. LX-29]WFB09604.1 hypothetical protein LRS74_23070 [Streptomyces sp. LX-29]
MKQIPVDTARLGALMCVVPPEPRTDRDTGQVRTDRDGRTQYLVGVAVRQMDARTTDVIEVVVPGEPMGITEGVRLRIDGLVATQWEIEGRKGVSWRATAVIPADAGPAAPAGGAGRGKASGGE